jgi:hypothetical protein
MEISEAEKLSELYKYYEDDYKLVPFAILFSNMHFELARPLNSYYRWEKILKRLELLQSIIPKNMTNVMQNTKHRQESIISKLIEGFLQENELPRVDASVLQKYKMHWYGEDNISILSRTPTKTISQLKAFLKEKDLKTKTSQNCIDIYEDKKFITRIFVLDASDDCFSVQKKNNVLVGTPHTIIYFLYMNMLNNIEVFDLKFFKSILTLERLFQKKHSKYPNTILTKDCYGTNRSFVNLEK